MRSHAALPHADIALQALDRLYQFGSVYAVARTAVIAQRVHAQLQRKHLVALAAPAQIVFGNAQKFLIGHAAFAGVGGYL